jgi:hypothetical protein
MFGALPITLGALLALSSDTLAVPSSPSSPKGLAIPLQRRSTVGELGPDDMAIWAREERLRLSTKYDPASRQVEKRSQGTNLCVSFSFV